MTQGINTDDYQQTIDRCLKELAIEAQTHPPKTKARQLALTKLLNQIQRSGLLCRPHKDLFQGFYEAIYAEAKQRLFCHICEKIDRYDSQREVLQWVNFLLRRRFFIEACYELYRQRDGTPTERQITWLTLEDLDRYSTLRSPSHELSLADQVLLYIKEDPGGVFEQTHIRNKPEANFKFIACQRVAGYRWEDISQQLNGIKVATLNSFYHRTLIRFAPRLRQDLSS